MLGRGALRQQAVVFAFHHRIAFAHPCFQLGTVEHGDPAAAVADQSHRLQMAGRLGHALAAPPSMLAISSWVMVNSFEGSWSRLNSSQRHSCCSTEWCRLHTAVCAI